MSVSNAQLLVNAVALYLGCGVLFAVPFLWRWVGRLDPVARHSTAGFKAIVFPGVVAFWPFFAVRLLAGRRAPVEEWTAHRRASARPAPPMHVEILQ